MSWKLRIINGHKEDKLNRFDSPNKGYSFSHTSVDIFIFLIHPPSFNYSYLFPIKSNEEEQKKLLIM